MTTSIPVLRGELEAAFAILHPQIRGLRDLGSFVSPDTELFKAIQSRLLALKRRRDFIRVVHHALADLEADGYPEIEKSFLPFPSIDALQAALADLQAAISTFDLLPVVRISLGEPRDKSAP